ncbi:MAG: hypothetical protein ACI9JN_001966 [Bacteroidia bacterium]|jgi:hypothetical protein
MPIRMVDDPQNPKKRSNNNPSKTGGLPRILLLFIPHLLKFLIKKPKLLIGLIIIGAGLYFFTDIFKGGGAVTAADSEEYNELATGLNMSQEMYDKSSIYEPLVAGYKNQLPARVSLEQYCPPRLNQGSQGSCVGWSSSYAARTIQQSVATGKSPKAVAFSPSSLYNQIKLPNCQGAYIHDAMEVMLKRGVLPFNDFKYNQYDCDATPSATQMSKATQFRTKGFERLWENEGRTDILAIKQNIAQGAPVVIGMLVGGSFMNAMQGRKLWKPTSSDRKMKGFGGHAMCVMGFDDNMEGGAFQIMNSWGDRWGDRGFCWIRYSDFEHFTKEAYGLHPMGNSKKQDPNKLAVAFGLLDNATMNNIPVKQVGNTLFRTNNAIAKGTRFKIEVTNSIECYTYVLGEETDGSSYVLFPYSSKHSPYCGITGTRLFPKTQSLMADDIGSTDRMAVVVSKVPIDVKALNKAMNSAPGNYNEKLDAVLAQYTAQNVVFKSGSVVRFDAEVNDKKAVAVVIEVQKK